MAAPVIIRSTRRAEGWRTWFNIPHLAAREEGKDRTIPFQNYATVPNVHEARRAFCNHFYISFKALVWVRVPSHP